MIFVTVGNSNIGFDRLIKKMDEISPRLPYDVVIQIGVSDYIPQNSKWFRYADYETMLRYFKQAKVIITHAGAGTILDVLLLGKVPIVVPRLKKFGEHIDDHQLEITKALEEKGLIIPVYETKYLAQAILNALELNTKLKPVKTIPPGKLIRILAEMVSLHGR